MLEYKEFKNKLKEEVQKNVGEEVYFQTVKKNNHQNKEILSIHTKDYNMVPVIYMDELYQEFERGRTLEECVDFVVSVLKTKKQVKIDHVLGTWEEKKNQVVIRMINLEWNKEKLKQIPHRIFYNLAITFRVENQIPDGGRARYDIDYKILRHWGITEAELVKTAFKNLKQTEYTIRGLEEIIMEMLGLAEEKKTEGGQYVMTNTERFYGASGMLRTDLLQQFAEENACDFYILPSSLHELILVPDRQELNEDQLRGMVREVNQEQVEMGERLSDEIYYFSRSVGNVEMVG